MSKLIIYATTSDAPQTLTAAPGPRNVPTTFPNPVNPNPFRVANTGATPTPSIVAKFDKETNLLITGARLDFLGAKGIRPAMDPQLQAAVCVCQFGTQTITISFNQFETFIPCSILVPAGVAIGPELTPQWNGSANPAIGRCRIEYDSLNMQAIYAGAEFSAALSLEIDLAGGALL